MALLIRLDINNKHRAGSIVIVRGDPHPKLPNHFYYSYRADQDTGDKYTGEVLHNYDNGAFALTAKVTKAIVAQQKEARAKK